MPHSCPAGVLLVPISPGSEEQPLLHSVTVGSPADGVCTSTHMGKIASPDSNNPYSWWCFQLIFLLVVFYIFYPPGTEPKPPTAHHRPFMFSHNQRFTSAFIDLVWLLLALRPGPITSLNTSTCLHSHQPLVILSSLHLLTVVLLN